MDALPNVPPLALHVALFTAAGLMLRHLALLRRRRALKRAFDKDGFVVVRGLLSRAEVARCERSIGADGGIAKHAFGRDDGLGRKTRLALWNHPGDDVLGMVARVPRVRGTMELLLGGSVYHYHSKLMMKDARTGGAHLWHQDYGYWSNNGCPFPRMGTCFITLDRMDAENAGLRVIRGSHEMGLIPHRVGGAQAEVDPTRLRYAQDLLETVQLVMEPGDAVFFHCIARCEDQARPIRRVLGRGEFPRSLLDAKRRRKQATRSTRRART